MKKLLLALACCITVFAVPITSYAAKDETNTYEYNVRDGKAVLTNYATTSNATRVEVPSEIDGYPVVGLNGTFIQNQRIESIIIPEGVEVLGDRTFSQARRLKDISLPSGLQKIGIRCFEDTAIETIELPDSIKTIGGHCFESTNIENIIVPRDIEKIEHAFANCQNLKTVDMSGTSINIVPIGAFNGCKSLNTVILPETIEIIGLNAFSMCESLENINIPEGLKEIGPIAFGNCKSLKELNLPKTLEKIGYSAFVECNLFDKFVIPENVNQIGSRFVSGENLKCIVNMSDKDFDRTTYEDNEYIWYLDSEFSKKAEFLPAKSSIYRRKLLSKDPIENDYAMRYVQELKKVEESGIPMSVANTREQAKAYIESIAPDGKDDKLSIKVEIKETGSDTAIPFQPAIAGTINNPDGTNGKFHVWVYITNTVDNDGDDTIIGRRITILATPYKPSSSGGSSGGGGSSSGGGGGSSSSKSGSSSAAPGSGLSISKPSILEGVWELIDSKWKLKIPDGSYASSLWARIADKWYLIGADGFMLTNWQMVNGKWYLLGQDGAMLDGWQFVNGKWYYMEPSGEMVTGWKWILDKCYYLDSTGAMLANTTTPDGYTVNENGEWIQ